MFEELMSKVRRAQAEFEFELARTFDTYRLQNLLHNHCDTMSNLHSDAVDMVKELEENQS